MDVHCTVVVHAGVCSNLQTVKLTDNLLPGESKDEFHAGVHRLLLDGEGTGLADRYSATEKRCPPGQQLVWSAREKKTFF